MTPNVTLAAALAFLICSTPLIAEDFTIQILDSGNAAIPGAAVEIRGLTQARQISSMASGGRGRVVVAIPVVWKCRLSENQSSELSLYGKACLD
jgi:hypothetical protein